MDRRDFLTVLFPLFMLLQLKWPYIKPKPIDGPQAPSGLKAIEATFDSITFTWNI